MSDPGPIVPSHTVSVVRFCRVRTFRDRYVYLDWLALFCAGEVHFGTAW